MRRGGPLRRDQPLKRAGALKRGPGPKARRRPGRAELVGKYMAAGARYCTLGPVIAPIDPGHACGQAAQGLHERRKASSGGSMTDPANLMPACNSCNGWVEDHPAAARRAGDRLVVREGDPEWAALGRRGDRL